MEEGLGRYDTYTRCTVVVQRSLDRVFKEYTCQLRVC